LGIDSVVTETTTKRIADAGVECAVAEPCFPVQVSHGHLRSLKESDADAILLPSQINSETDDPSTASHACPWGQTLPFVLGHSPAAEGLESRLLRPIVHFREGEAFIEKELWPLFRRYAADRSHHKNAVALGYAAQRLFQERIHKLGAEALAELDRKDAMAIVLVGRPYNLCDPGLNLNLPAKLRALYGIDVIPMDFLPSEGVRVGEFQPNMYWNYGRRILRAAKWTATQPRLHLIYLTNFKCGPDSYLKNFAADAAEKPFLTLQFDAHGNDAGMMTRCEAYLDSKGFMRWWNTPKAQVSKAEPCTSRACAPERHKYSPEPSAP
jgi:predicted nucleotide-binding protein (sugar kinase/HSP70/actin superfamily)